MHNYGGNPGVDGFSDELKKVRDVVHKAFPRELSPTRLIEKYGADMKKKASLKFASNAAKQTAELDKIKTDSIAKIQADAANGIASSGLVPVAQPAPTDNSPIYMAAAAGGLLLLLLVAKGKSS